MPTVMVLDHSVTKNNIISVVLLTLCFISAPISALCGTVTVTADVNGDGMVHIKAVGHYDDACPNNNYNVMFMCETSKDCDLGFWTGCASGTQSVCTTDADRNGYQGEYTFYATLYDCTGRYVGSTTVFIDQTPEISIEKPEGSTKSPFSVQATVTFKPSLSPQFIDFLWSDIQNGWGYVSDSQKKCAVGELSCSYSYNGIYNMGNPGRMNYIRMRAYGGRYGTVSQDRSFYIEPNVDCDLPKDNTGGNDSCQ